MATASLAWRMFGRRRPTNIMLAVTDRCTNRCAICRIPERNLPDLPLPAVCRLLDEAAALGCARLGLWGGEPLVRDDLPEIIRRGRQHQMFVTVDTNGHLLPERDDVLTTANHLNISLDGDRVAHDTIRGAGAFDRTMRGLEYATGRCPFWTITVLSRANLDQIDWLLDLARRHRAMTTFQVLHHNDVLGCNEAWLPDPGDLREAIRLLAARKNEGAPIASSTKYLQQLLDWPDFRLLRDSRRRHVPCAAGDLYCNVDVNGDLYACSLLVGEQPAPNAVELGFAEAFARLQRPDCQSCLAACFTEYNLLCSLDWQTGWSWVRSLRK